jgi:hypothetical protein
LRSRLRALRYLSLTFSTAPTLSIVEKLEQSQSYGGQRPVKVEAVLFSMGAAVVVGWMVLNFWFFHVGSPVPDRITGRMYAVQEMGTLYIIPMWAHLSSLLCFVGFAAMAIAAGTALLRVLVKSSGDFSKRGRCDPSTETADTHVLDASGIALLPVGDTSKSVDIFS